MRRFSEYDLLIFDCDGVVIDSNELKIEAMGNALNEYDINESKLCLNYFRHNFGKSRFHHVEIFVNDYLSVPEDEREKIVEKILGNYSTQCRELYIRANLTEGIIELLKRVEASCFIASGSEQNELREVFKKRELDTYFNGIFGSPTKKSKIVANILSKTNYQKAVMIGDAVSDFEAAKNNEIDFIAYTPYSNVSKELKELSIKEGFVCLDSYEEINW